MLKHRFLVFIAIVAAAAGTSFAQKSTTLAVVQAFYDFDAKNSQTFGRAAIDARKKWFSSELYQLFLNEIKREKEYLKKNPTDKPHFGDGLPFRPLDETCHLGRIRYKHAISYGTVTVKGDAANVDVYFKYPKGCNIPDILCALNMEKEKGRWVISDIRFFPGDTSLVDDLKRREY